MARIKDTMKVISDTRGKIDKNYDMFASNAYSAKTEHSLRMSGALFR